MDLDLDAPLSAKEFARFRAGDHRAFTTLVCPFEPRLRAVAARVLGDLDEAEDTAQDALMRAWRERERVDPERPLYPWLRTLTKHLALNRLRDRIRRSRRERDILRWELIVDRVHDEADRASDERLSALQQCLQGVDEDNRELLRRRYAEGCSVQDLAAALGQRANSLSMRLTRLRRALGDCIDQRLQEALP